jgi:hypothetical protein
MIPSDWIWGAVGGLMIGGAAAIYLLVNGRIMGASGILGGLVDGTGRSTMMERLAFLFGALVVPPPRRCCCGGCRCSYGGCCRCRGWTICSVLARMTLHHASQSAVVCTIQLATTPSLSLCTYA